MVKFDIPKKENFTTQVITSIVVLVLVAVVVAILSKLLVGVIVFLLGAVFGVSSQYMGGGPFSKNE